MIKRASLGDLADLESLFDAYLVFYGKKSNLHKQQEFLRSRIEAEESYIFIAYEDKKAVGFVQLYPSFSSVSLAKIMVLNDLFVDENFRKKGFGEQLIQRALTLAKEMHAVRVDLETAHDNLQAQSLYQSIGFSRNDKSFHYSIPV